MGFKVFQGCFKRVYNKNRKECSFNLVSQIFAILASRDIYKIECGSETDQFIFVLSHSGLKTTKFAPSSANWPKTGPDRSQVSPSGPSNPN